MHSTLTILTLLALTHASLGALLPQHDERGLSTTFTYNDSWVETLVLPEPHELRTLDYEKVVTAAIPGFFASNFRLRNHTTNSSFILNTQLPNVTTVSNTVTVVKETSVTVAAPTLTLAATNSMAVTATITITATAHEAEKRGDVDVNRVGFGGGLGGLLKPLVGDLLKPGGKKKPGDEKKPDKSKDEHPPPATSKAGASMPNASKPVTQPETSKFDTPTSKSPGNEGSSKTGSASSKDAESKTSGALGSSLPTMSKSADATSVTGTSSQDASSSGDVLKSSAPTFSGSGATKSSGSDEARTTSTTSRNLSVDPSDSRRLTASLSSLMTAHEKGQGNEVNIGLRPTGIPTVVSKGVIFKTARSMLQSYAPTADAAGSGKTNSAGVPEEPNTTLMIMGFVFLLVLCY